MRIRDSLYRRTLLPALRLFRDTLIDRPDVARLRRWAARLDANLANDEPASAVREIALPQCPARWIDAPGADPRKVVLYLHGGAFIVATPRLHGAFVARLARATGMGALVPAYRLAPEHPFPAAPEDALAAYRWLLAQGFEAARIVVAGDSAGGNLCLGLLQRLRHEGLPLPACAVALSPVTDGSFSGESIRRNDGHDPMFTARGFHALAPLYMPDPAQRTLPVASPLFGDLGGLPPTLLLAGSSELLLDDAVRYALRCPNAQLQVWHGMPHVFPLFDFLPEAGQALHGIGRFIAEQLARAAAARPVTVAGHHGSAPPYDENSDSALPANCA